MYYQHTYTAPKAGDFLKMPTYMYDGSSYSQGFGEACGDWDLLCKADNYFKARDAALTSDINIPEQDPRLLYGMVGVLIVVLGITGVLVYKSLNRSPQ